MAREFPENLPETIYHLDYELTRIFQRHTDPGITEAMQNMLRQLHIAVHGKTWARPQEPRTVWLGLLDEVIRMRETLEFKERNEGTIL